MANKPLIDFGQIKPLDRQAGERIYDNAIPISKIDGLQDKFDKEAELVLTVTQGERYKLIAYDKDYLPRVTVITDDGREILCSVSFVSKTLVNIEWNVDFEGTIYIK